MMFTENEKAANELKSRILKTFENADKALKYKKDRIAQYSDLVNSMKKSKEESLPEYSDQQMKDFFTKASKSSTPLILPVNKDRSLMNAKRDAEMMRVNNELLGKEIVTFKPLLIKSSSSMGSAPAMMTKPPKDTLKKMKKLRNKVASTNIPSIDTINPDYINQLENKYKNKVPASPWLVHVKNCMKENNYTFKEARY